MDSTKPSAKSPRTLLLTEAQYQELWGAFGVTNFVEPIRPKSPKSPESPESPDANSTSNLAPISLPSIQAMHYDFEYGNR